MERRLLRPSEAAELLGICRAQIYRLIATGELPAVRLGPKCVRVDRLGLEKWLLERTAAVR